MASLIACTSNIIIYAMDTDDGDVEIKFLKYNGLYDRNCIYNKIYYRDFKDGYRNLTPFEMGIYNNLIFCRIGGNLYKVYLENELYEVVDTDFCGVCFMERYVLLVKDEDKFYKIIPTGTEITEITEIKVSEK